METFSKRKLERLQKCMNDLMMPEQQIFKLQRNVSILDEKYLNYGDYVITFENPDHEDYQFRRRTLTFQDILTEFEKSFDVDCSFESINEENELYRLAFYNVFHQLHPPHKEFEYEPMERDDDFLTGGKKHQQSKMYIINPQGKQLRINPNDEKIMGGGHFMMFNIHNKCWERTQQPVKDISTLLRIYTLTKLSRFGGFFIRQFLSMDGTKIYAILYQELGNLKLEAERTGLKKRVDIAYCDIMSLEPVDASLRPLRLNSLLTDKNYPNPTVGQKEIKSEVNKVLEKINYAKLAKECGQAPYDFVGEIMMQQHITVKVWKAYLYYLKRISIGMSKIRHKYKKLSDVATLTSHEIKQLVQIAKEGQYKKFSKKKCVQEQAHHDHAKISQRIIKEFNKHKKAKEIKDLLLDSTKQCHKLYGHILQNLWEKSSSEPVGPYIEYFQPNKQKNYSSTLKVEFLWNYQIINENGDESLFNRMERAKLCTSILTQIVNLDNLEKQDHIVAYYIPNNYFDLQGQSQVKKCRDIKEATKNDATVLFSYNSILQVKTKIQQFLNISDKQKDKEREKEEKQSKKKLIKGGLNLSNLSREWGVLNVPLYFIAEYYGERIALYFMFLSYFIEELIPISFFGIVTLVVQFLYEPSQVPNKVALVFFTLLIVFWSSTFQSMWCRKEIEFQTMFGLEDVETNKTELVGFVGKPSRSIGTDKLNELSFSSATTWIRLSLGLLLVMVFIAIEVVIIVFLQKLILYFEEEQNLPQISFLDMEVLVPALIWVVCGMILDSLFRPFAFRLTKWENHKYLSQFEASFIIKNLLFSTVNRLGQPFIIAFIDGYTLGCVNDNNCYQQLQIYMRVCFLIDFGKHLFLGFIFPMLKQFAQRALQEVGAIVDFDMKLYKESPYFQVNKSIETEYKKDNYTFAQVDGTIWEYLELSLQFALLANYGSPFPAVFVLAFGMNCFELMIDKYRLMWLTKRPAPQSARSIGTFIHYLDLVTYGSIFTNSALLAYTNTELFTDTDSFMLFILLMIGLFIFKFITDAIYGSVDPEVYAIKQRHKQIERRISIGQRTKSGAASEPAFPIMKIYGTLLE